MAWGRLWGRTSHQCHQKKPGVEPRQPDSDLQVVLRCPRFRADYPRRTTPNFKPSMPNTRFMV